MFYLAYRNKLGATKFANMESRTNKHDFKGTVQRKLTGVLSGVNRKLMILAWVALGLFYILRGLGP
jgi:hypothetical protein